MKHTLLLYEDNDRLRESLCSLLTLANEFDVLGAFSNCLKAETHVLAYHPEVILMDIDMPGRNGIEAVKQIRLVNKQVQIIMLTVFDDNIHVFEALKAGANGYLLKKYISEKLTASIKEVLEGGAPMSPSIARMVIADIQQTDKQKTDYQLTKREKEILHSLSQGNSFKMIAAEISLSVETVRTHIKHIYEKLQVNSQTEAVIKAINEKLV